MYQSISDVYISHFRLKAPQLLMQSGFIIEVLSHHLKLMQGSVEDFGPPIGAMALAAAAVRV
jgi:hypothetical protein